MFEYRLLGIYNDKSCIEEELERGTSHLEEWQDMEIQKKYGHFLLKAFESEHLDNDGGTTNIKKIMRSGGMLIGSDPSDDGHVEAKYRHLAPTSYDDDATPLGLFKYKRLKSNDDTRRIETELKKGNKNFLNEAEAVRQKHGYLVSQDLDPVLEFEQDHPPLDCPKGDLVRHLWIELWRSENIFEGRDGKIMEKYGHLMSNDHPPKPTEYADKENLEFRTVARLEHEYALSHLGAELEENLKNLLSQGQNIFEGWNGEGWKRYGHLMAHYRPRDLAPYWLRKVRNPPRLTMSLKVILWRRHRAGCRCCNNPPLIIRVNVMVGRIWHAMSR